MERFRAEGWKSTIEADGTLRLDPSSEWTESTKSLIASAEADRGKTPRRSVRHIMHGGFNAIDEAMRERMRDALRNSDFAQTMIAAVPILSDTPDIDLLAPGGEIWADIHVGYPPAQGRPAGDVFARRISPRELGWLHHRPWEKKPWTNVQVAGEDSERDIPFHEGFTPDGWAAYQARREDADRIDVAFYEAYREIMGHRPPRELRSEVSLLLGLGLLDAEMLSLFLDELYEYLRTTGKIGQARELSLPYFKAFLARDNPMTRLALGLIPDRLAARAPAGLSPPGFVLFWLDWIAETIPDGERLLEELKEALSPAGQTRDRRQMFLDMIRMAEAEIQAAPELLIVVFGLLAPEAKGPLQETLYALVQHKGVLRVIGPTPAALQPRAVKTSRNPLSNWLHKFQQEPELRTEARPSPMMELLRIIMEIRGKQPWQDEEKQWLRQLVNSQPIVGFPTQSRQAA